MDSYPTCDCAGCVAKRYAAAVATLMPTAAILTDGKDWCDAATYHRQLGKVVKEDDGLESEEV